MTNGYIMKNIELQREVNRMQHGEDKTKSRTIQDWALIASEHMGHLTGAVLKTDQAEIEKELLHVMAPLIELYYKNKEAK